MGETTDEQDRLLRQTLLQKGLATPKQIEGCLASRTAAGRLDLGAVLVERGILTPAQLARVRRESTTTIRRVRAQTNDPLVGQVLANEFRLVRLLGRGGMGSVYLAEQVSLQRSVAVKILPLTLAAAHGKLAERFRKEALAAARLHHPHIVQVYFFGEQAGQYFIAMEYVEGETLEERLQRQGNLPVRDAVVIAIAVCRALSAAHAQGLVHRDVKPGNIFLGRDATVKLGDFGLVRDLAAARGFTTTGHALGTPFYMAPEQAQGQVVDARADLYALGATLFHALTGRPPYSGDTFVEVANKHLSEPLPSIASFGRDAPRRLCLLVRRLLAKTPGGRPPSADAVAEQLAPQRFPGRSE